MKSQRELNDIADEANETGIAISGLAELLYAQEVNAGFEGLKDSHLKGIYMAIKCLGDSVAHGRLANLGEDPVSREKAA